MRLFYVTKDGADWNTGRSTVEYGGNIGPILYGNQIYFLDSKFVAALAEASTKLNQFGDSLLNTLRIPFTVDSLQEDDSAPGSNDHVWRVVSALNSDFADHRLWLAYYDASDTKYPWKFLHPFEGCLIDYSGTLYQCVLNKGTDITWRYYSDAVVSA